MEAHLNLACSLVYKHTQQMKPKFIWKFEHFSQRRDLAKNDGPKICTSQPQTTGPRGYKIQVVVYPDGCGEGAHTHLYVFAKIVQGKYDAILPWPFKLGETFTLIDQQADPAERENVQRTLTPAKYTHLPQNI